LPDRAVVGFSGTGLEIVAPRGGQPTAPQDMLTLGRFAGFASLARLARSPAGYASALSSPLRRDRQKAR
jgi:hypothetical protein